MLLAAGVTPEVHDCGFFIVIWIVFISQVYGALGGYTIQSSLYFELIGMGKLNRDVFTRDTKQ
ncbi:hypothetical protein [Mucilaginibacter rubeus]|uniref:hypothetical protein n=1 Tax=Mucilaginibacter rubeus TaxID=2027860 RepID=UPI00166AACF6|nr:hypothetical protein [Mucilaginibacter rubeus]